MLRALERRCNASAILDGEDARDALASEDPDDPYDLVLLDLCMPKLRGREVYEWLASAAPELAARVVIVTGGPTCPADIEFIASFPNPILYKPLLLEDLLAVVGRRARRDSAA